MLFRLQLLELSGVAFDELDLDQRREAINTAQRFQSWRDAFLRARDYRGSMTWSRSKEREYLLRSSYDKRGRRRQTSLGPRSAETEAIKAKFETARSGANRRLEDLRGVILRQAAVNRALRLGRMPLTGARALRALDVAGLLGAGIRVLGTNAMYAYEAIAGVRFGGEFLDTADVDLLLDTRGGLTFVASDEVEDVSLLRLLQRVDRSFERTSQAFRAANKDGYMVDLIKPVRDPPWNETSDNVGIDPSDLTAVEIAGLAWHESAPSFEAVVIDARGEPLRFVTSDPRVFAAHKLWLSERLDRDPLKRRRDRAQAKAVAALVATYMPNLPFARSDMRMLPRSVFDAAEPLFVEVESGSAFSA